MVLTSLKALSKNASRGAEENDEKYHKRQTAFSPESNLGSSGYEEQLLNTGMRRSVLMWCE
jgi:hypothetical protein